MAERPPRCRQCPGWTGWPPSGTDERWRSSGATRHRRRLRWDRAGCASKPNALKQAWITASEPERQAFVDALAKLPAEKQRSVAETAKRGEQVSAVTAFSTCDPEASKTSDGTGGEAEPAPTLDPRAWSMSTAQQRQVFVKAIGRSEIEDAFHAIESGYALTRGLNRLNQAWSAATDSDQRTFYRQQFPANAWHRFRT
jgi:hypothetical protein